MAKDNSPAAVARAFILKEHTLYCSGHSDGLVDNLVCPKRLANLIAAERRRCARVARRSMFDWLGNPKSLFHQGAAEASRRISLEILALDKPPRRGRKEK